MRFSISIPRPKFWQALIVALLVANLALTGARALAGDFEGGNPPPGPISEMRFHLGCTDKDGNARIFVDQHSSYGTNPPHDACKDTETPIGIYIGHP